MTFLTRLWRGQARLTTWDAATDFLDRQAAFLANRTMYEYARARAGVLSMALLKELPFQEAVERGRWQAYPIALGYVSEVADTALRAPAEAFGRRDALIEALAEAIRALAARYPAPQGVDAERWAANFREAEAKLRLRRSAPHRPPSDIPDAGFRDFFDLMPLHPSVTLHDYDMVRNNVRGMLLNIADRWRAQADVDALLAALAPDQAP